VAGVDVADSVVGVAVGAGVAGVDVAGAAAVGTATAAIVVGTGVTVAGKRTYALGNYLELGRPVSRPPRIFCCFFRTIAPPVKTWTHHP